MNYFRMKRSKYKERFITDILMGDMESGDVGFLIYAYNKLGLRGNKRIRQMWKAYKKISQNPAYEDIIRIIVEEIFQKGNKELFNDLMAYYLERFPDVKEGFENNEDNIEEWVKIYDGPDNKSDSGLPSFLRKSFVMLYCVTYGEPGAVKGFLTIWGEWRNEHYMDGKYSFYDKQRNRGTTIQMLCEHAGAINSRYIHRQYEEIIKQQRKEMADYYEIEEDEIEEFVLESILHSTENLREIDNSLYAVEFENIQDGLNHICKKYHMNQLELWDYSNWRHYLDMIKDIFIDWCKRECRNFMLEQLDEGVIDMEEASVFVHGDPERCLSELMVMFWFECYAMNQQKIWDEYYSNFSFDRPEKDSEELCMANARLTDELSQCKKKLQQYADADSERKRKENKEAKKADRQYIEKIASLEKKLEEYEIEMAHQKKVLSDMDTYISLIETGNNLNDATEEADISKIYNNNILFVGGLPEMISRLKAVFSTATFVDNETMAFPQKIDLIVLLGGDTDNALYYTYIGFARDKGIEVIYCNGSNAESITMQVAGCL